jgi:hypothetical protein
MLVNVTWDANTLLPYAALDPILFGKLFSQEIDDTTIDGYRIEQFDFDNDEYLALPNTTARFSEFDAKDNVAVKVRIRIVKTDGTVLPAVVSKTYLVRGFVYDLRKTGSTLMFSFL